MEWTSDCCSIQHRQPSSLRELAFDTSSNFIFSSAGQQLRKLVSELQRIQHYCGHFGGDIYGQDLSFAQSGDHCKFKQGDINSPYITYINAKQSSLELWSLFNQFCQVIMVRNQLKRVYPSQYSVRADFERASCLARNSWMHAMPMALFVLDT